MRLDLIPPVLYDDRQAHELCARPDAEETFARVAQIVDDEIVATLMALAVLRAREAAERRCLMARERSFT